MSVAPIMFSLIRSEICGTALEESIKTELSAKVCKELFALSNMHDVAHIVASALFKNELLGEEDISAAFKKVFMMAVYRDVQREYSLKQVNAVLEDANVPHILLKGAILRKYYPQTWMRTSCDVDVLVKNEDIDCAINALCEAGYVRVQDASTHDYNLTSPNKIHIELHYTLSQDGEFANADAILNDIWHNVFLTENSKCSYQLPAEQFILYHLVHMGRHLLHGGCGVRPFIDLWLLESKMSYNESKLRAILLNTGLVSLYDAASNLGKVWLENKEHTEQTRLLEEYILFGGVYGNSRNSAKVQAAKGVSKTKSFLNLMFLSRENLEVLYPNLKKHPTMLPLYHIKRWFRIFNKKKRDKVKYLTKTRNNVGQASANTTKVMLEYLGLLNK